MHSQPSASVPVRTRPTYHPQLWVDVWQAQDPWMYAGLDIPRSTRLWWRDTQPPDEIVGAQLFDRGDADLRRENDTLKRRTDVLVAVVRLFVTLVRVLGINLRGRRLPDGRDKARILHAVERAADVVGLVAALRIIGLSSSRYHQWRGRTVCLLDDQSRCPRSSPAKLRFAEVQTIGDFVVDTALRHMSTQQLALHAQRIGKLFASAATWYRYMRVRGWNRPVVRLHFPPREGIRATRPNEIWHIDETLLTLTDGTRVYIQAVIDNFSRFVLAWHVSLQHGGAWSVDLLRAAETWLRPSEPPPTLVCDGGGENINQAVDDHLLSGVVRRLIARSIELRASNSMIERFWYALKHRCLLLRHLDTIDQVLAWTGFFVQQHNQVAPQVALRGRTPEEAYVGRAVDLPGQLAAARDRARRERIDHNRNLSCAACTHDRATTGPPNSDTRVGPRAEPAGEEAPTM